MKDTITYILSHKLNVAVLPAVAFGLSHSVRSVRDAVMELGRDGLVTTGRRMVSDRITGAPEPLYESNEYLDASRVSHILRHRWDGPRSPQVFVSTTRRCLNLYGGIAGHSRSTDTDHDALLSWVFFSLPEKSRERWMNESRLLAQGFAFNGQVPDAAVLGRTVSHHVLHEVGGSSYTREKLLCRHEAWAGAGIISFTEGRAMSGHERTNLSVLRRPGLYGLDLKSVLEARTFQWKECGHVLNRHEGDGLLVVHSKKTGDSLPGGVTWIQLTKKGCEAIGVPVERAAPVAETALHQRLSVLWFCEAGEEIHVRLEPEHTCRLLGIDYVPSNVPYVLSTEPTGSTVFRTYVSRGSVATAIQQVERIREEFLEDERLVPLVTTGHLGVLVLADRAPKITALTNALKKSQKGEPSLEFMLRVKVSMGPSPDTIADCLKRWKKGRDVNE